MSNFMVLELEAEEGGWDSSRGFPLKSSARVAGDQCRNSSDMGFCIPRASSLLGSTSNMENNDISGEEVGGAQLGINSTLFLASEQKNKALVLLTTKGTSAEWAPHSVDTKRSGPNHGSQPGQDTAGGDVFSGKGDLIQTHCLMCMLLDVNSATSLAVIPFTGGLELPDSCSSQPPASRSPWLKLTVAGIFSGKTLGGTGGFETSAAAISSRLSLPSSPDDSKSSVFLRSMVVTDPENQLKVDRTELIQECGALALAASTLTQLGIDVMRHKSNACDMLILSQLNKNVILVNRPSRIWGTFINDQCLAGQLIYSGIRSQKRHYLHPTMKGGDVILLFHRKDDTNIMMVQAAPSGSLSQSRNKRGALLPH
ncbi:hypothetical protein IHE44_0002868 [Lamprotornis superbus]|uniref:Uncharacterized protein n=1 Tax=Lamprotornis superbus TaxID=245042 RepID=A0A835U1Q3_9PASS|nr:hypothetical protein IHE44_0002868 [Lamprotornis superbus]